MNFLKKVRNYVCYCGVEKEEFKELKKGAYASNYEVWKILHFMMLGSFAFLFVVSLLVKLFFPNRIFYLALFIYSAAATASFFFLKKDSLIAQLIIYLSISMLFLFSALITQNKPDIPATTFVVLLLITPMFMIDRPYFMAIELTAASVVFLVWMYFVKPYEIWVMDRTNVIIFWFVGIFLHVVANSIRIKEFVLTRKINIQKDTDDMTGLKNKGALTAAINAFLASDAKEKKAMMILLDIDHFKKINDTYGHDIGDTVIRQLGDYLLEMFTGGEIVGRFGGDEFIIFIKDQGEVAFAESVALKIAEGASKYIKLPKEGEKVSVSMGIAFYNGVEKNYSELFKEADIALYQVKADRKIKFRIYQ